MFVIDVSYTAVVTGMLDCVVATIKDAIHQKKLPGGSRAQMGIITFDTALHFYNLNSNLAQPQMLVVSDLEDLFLPLPDDILVPINESESAIVTLLDSLPAMFGDTTVNESCLGSAVKGAFMAMKHIGGKMLVFGSCIPSVGDLSLKSTRDNPRLLGTEKEVELLRPVSNKDGSDGYKDLGTELTRAQISLELFMAPHQYVDLASISPIAKFTGGDVRFYPQFHINTLGLKLRTELMHVLSRYMGWEAVMRVRVSRGWKITNFYGHLFVRGQDLLLVPNCHTDQTFAISFDMDENVNPDPVFCMQSALLYTNSDGERRIRVHTWASLLTQNYADMIGSINVQATIAMLSQITLKHTLKTSLPEGRNMLQNQCQQFVQAGNVCPNVEALQFLPLYVMGMLKSPAFRGPNDITPDMRTYIWSRLENIMISQLSAYYYPRMIALHNIPGDCGIPDEDGVVALPEMLNLSSESMTQDGVFLLEDGETLNVWIGNSVDPGFLQTVFGVPSFDQLESAAAEAAIGTRGDPVSNQVGHILAQVRRERSMPYLPVNIIRQGEQLREIKFFASLIEDRTIGLQSTYPEFLSRMGYRPQQQQASPTAAPPMGMAPPMGGMTPGAMGAMTTSPAMMGPPRR
jgi:protein transport protein SEC24